jgi:hypothetical protein
MSRHGQTFAGGAIAGLALARNPLWIFAAGIVVGVLIVLLARFGRRLVELGAEWARRRPVDEPGTRYDVVQGARRRA